MDANAAVKAGLSQLGSLVSGGNAFLTLNVNGTDLSEVLEDVVSELTHLQHVELKEAKISDATPLGLMKDVVHLDISSNQLKAQPVLKDLRFLQVLKLANNSIATVGSLKAHPYLHTLDLSHNQLTDLKALESNPLRLLSVAHNQLASLEGLKCPALETLTASNNQIKKVAVRLPALQKLDLESNELDSLETFQSKAELPSVTTLNLRSNQLPAGEAFYKQLSSLGEWWSHGTKQPLASLSTLQVSGQPWMLEEEGGFDEAKHPTEVLVYLPKLQVLDQLPFKDEENEVPFPTPEQLEEAATKRAEIEEAEKTEAERLRLEAEKKQAEEDAAAAAAEAEAADAE